MKYARSCGLVVVAVWLLATTPASSSTKLTSSRVPPCATGTQHQRWSLKNRTLDVDVDPTPIRFAALLEHVAPAEADRGEAHAIDPFEQTFLHLAEAYACVIKQSADDCDLHVELAARPSECDRGARVIVEIPAKAGKEVQETALDALGLERLGTAPHVFHVPPAVQVFGWGFYDLAHRCEKEPTRGCQHGSRYVATLAEIHPARVEPLR